MGLRQQVADLVTEVGRLRILLENHAAAGHATAADLRKVHDEVKSARSDMAGMADAAQASLTAVTQSLNGVLAKAAELAGSPAPKPPAKTAAAKAPASTGKENS